MQDLLVEVHCVHLAVAYHRHLLVSLFRLAFGDISLLFWDYFISTADYVGICCW